MTVQAGESPNSRPATLAVLGACLLWAISFIATKEALTAIPPLSLVFFRLVLSTVCFALLFAALGLRPRRRSLPEWTTLFLLSLAGTSLHYATQTWGLAWTGAARASLYAATGPIAILLLAVVFHGERLTPLRVLGLMLALTGSLTVSGNELLLQLSFPTALFGDLLVLLSILLWGAFTVFGKEMTRRIPALELTGLVTALGALSMLPLAAAEMLQTEFQFAAVPARAWLAVAFLGLTCSFLATLLYFLALERMDSATVGIYLYTIPPLTTLFSIVWLDERVTLAFLFGGLLVLAGVRLTEKDGTPGTPSAPCEVPQELPPAA